MTTAPAPPLSPAHLRLVLAGTELAGVCTALDAVSRSAAALRMSTDDLAIHNGKRAEQTLERLTEDLCRVLESGVDSDRNPITPAELAHLLALGGGGPAVRAVARRASIWLYYTQLGMAQDAHRTRDARIITFIQAALIH